MYLNSPLCIFRVYKFLLLKYCLSSQAVSHLSLDQVVKMSRYYESVNVW